MTLKKTITVLFIALGLISSKCKDKKEPVVDEFNKAGLLTNFADNLIVPQYTSFSNSLGTLASDYQTFISTPDQTNLTAVQNSLMDTYLKWNEVKTYEFGPAASIGFRSAIGTFPVDSLKIESNVTNGGYSLGSLANIDAIGLAALEFMLYRTDALSYFSNANYKTYGTDIIQKMQTETAYVLSQWQSNYSATFKASTGTEATSGFSLLINEFNKDYEIAKNAKVGIPIGKQSLGIIRPEYIEARFSGKSLDLLRASIVSSQLTFNGNTTNNSPGLGFDDYLIALDKGSLASSINTKYKDILNQIDLVRSNGTLEYNMNNNLSELETLYVKLQELVVLIKTDMSSSFGVLITYQDNDGD